MKVMFDLSAFSDLVDLLAFDDPMASEATAIVRHGCPSLLAGRKTFGCVYQVLDAERETNSVTASLRRSHDGN